MSIIQKIKDFFKTETTETVEVKKKPPPKEEALVVGEPVHAMIAQWEKYGRRKFKVTEEIEERPDSVYKGIHTYITIEDPYANTLICVYDLGRIDLLGFDWLTLDEREYLREYISKEWDKALERFKKITEIKKERERKKMIKQYGGSNDD